MTADDSDRPTCTMIHNPGEWPYIARCVRKRHTDPHHVDAKGRIWKAVSSCREVRAADLRRYHRIISPDSPLAGGEVSDVDVDWVKGKVYVKVQYRHELDVNTMLNVERDETLDVLADGGDVDDDHEHPTEHWDCY